MKMFWVLDSIVAACVLLVGAPVARADKPSGEAAAAPNLDTLKKLAGDWVEIGKDGKTTDRVVSSIRVTAGGSAVLETLFPGTDHEMVTMYHQDGEDLVLTHYCVLGNQPRMRAERDAAPSKLVFKFIGGTNFKPEKDAHMHDATITIVNEDHIRSEWIKCEEGKPCHTARFDLARKKK